MLILTRKVGESVISILDPQGRELRFTILGVKGATVRVGVDAPQDVKIWRDEVAARIRREGRER